MRILILSWNFPPALGGIEVVVDHLFRGLSRRGHEVGVLTAHAPAAAPAERVERAPRRGIPAFLRFCLARGAALCRELRPEVLVCGSIVSAPAAWWLSRRFKIPYVVLMHGSDILYGGWFYQTAVRFLIRRAARLAANSEGTRELLLQAGVRPERVRVVHPGVDVPAFERAAERPLRLPGIALEGRRVLVTVGRLIRRKGVMEFVTHVLPPLVKSHPDLLYLVVGEDAKLSLAHKERLRDRIEARIRELGLDGHARLLGKLDGDDLLQVLSASTAFVLPCLEIPGDVEGFGIVFLEAALRGAPAVSTRVGGIPDAVVDGETGLLCPPGDAGAMIAAIRRLLDEPGLRDRLADAAARRARSTFSWDAVTGRYEELFREAVAP